LAIELHPVVKNFKMVTLGNAILKRFQGFILEFDNLSTSEADQVVMMAPSGSGFILSLSRGKLSLISQAEAGEKLQSSVDRRIANFGIDLSDLGIDLGKVLVLRGVEKDIQDLLPLLGGLQPFPTDPCFEEALFDWEFPS
jgi:hypothetical protein